MAKPLRSGLFPGEIFTYPNGERWEWKVLRNSSGVIIKQNWNILNGPTGTGNRLDDFLEPNPGFGNIIGVGTGDLSINFDANENVELNAFGTLPGANTINTTPSNELMGITEAVLADLQFDPFNPVIETTTFEGNSSIVAEERSVSIMVKKTPDRGNVYLDESLTTRELFIFPISEIPSSGHTFKLNWQSKTHPDVYTIRQIRGDVGVKLFKNGVVVSKTESGRFPSDINWDTSIWDVVIQPNPIVSIEVSFDSSIISSLLNYSFDGNSGNLTEGVFEANDSGIFSITPTTSEYNFEYTLRKNGNVLSNSSSPNQSYNLVTGENYTLHVSASKGIIPEIQPPVFGKPVISVSSNSISYNLAGGGPSISYSTAFADKVTYSLGNVTRTLPANGTVRFSPSDFGRVGTFELYLQPVSNNGGSGESTKVIINVSETKSFAGPDITHITYPENIIGEDFKGYNVDFRVSWTSINTNWVDVWVGKISNQTKIATKRDAQGQLTLNVKDVLTKAGKSLAESVDVVDFKLLFIPYNDEGDSTFAGKTEEITISFDKGNLRLRRGNVVRDIREAISKQFDKSILQSENSKYLTHLLHLGEGDNKLISTWGVDTETFSEYEVVDPLTGREEKTKEVKTLVLKLYEPLPKSIQPNQQVWMSKIQSIPLIEQMTVIDEVVEECISLQPNFNEKFTDNVGLLIYDDLIASGSTSSTDLVNQFVSGSGFDLKKLDIQFTSSNGNYVWENFVKYSSAEERVENYIYKVNLIDFYNQRIDLVTSGSEYTSSISLSNEKERLESQINGVVVGFDAFENHLYISGENASNLLSDARTYDYNNINGLVRNLPQHVQDDDEGQEFVLFFHMLGQHFDTLWLHTKALAESKKLEHKYESGIKDEFLYQMLESLGWDADMGVQSQALWEYAYGNWNADGDERDIDESRGSVLKGKENQNQIWRRILNNLPYLLKHKGSKRALHALMSCYGIPSSMLTVMEFGGPRDVNESGTTKFTYDDRTASINVGGSAAITIPWKEYSGTNDYPNSFEIRLSTEERVDQRIVSGSGWSLHLLKDTGSHAKVELKVLEGSTLVSQSTNPFPFYNDEFTHITINKSVVGGNDTFEIFAKEGFQERIRNEVSTSFSVSGTSGWTSGSELVIGGSTLTASIDEVRLWTTPLLESVIDNHTLLPDAINGNHNSASTEDLLLRLDFEYPKDRGTDVSIKNVAIKQTYETHATASNFDSISEYPYNYTPYERTVTAQVPQSGFNYSNKVRFETQYNLDGSEIGEDGLGLSYRERSTQKSYEQSPIDSDRLGLFFSPIKEINMDILRSVGPINIDDFIGNPSDDYNDSYKDLTTFREYYFQRYNLNFNEYVQLVRYIDRTLFDQLESLVPARAKVAKGLLIEPHILERSKTKWNRPSGEENYHEVSIDTTEDTIVTSEELTKLALVSTSEDIHVSTEQPFYDGYVSGGADVNIISDISNLDGTFVTTNSSIQSGFIQRNEEATMGGFEFNIDAKMTGSVDAFYDSTTFTEVGGFGNNDLAVAGFNLFGSGSYSIRTRLDGNGNIIKDRVKVFKVKERYTEAERQQISGYPTTTGSNDYVIYDVVDVDKFREFVTILPWNGDDITNTIDRTVTPLNGTFSTHYRFVEDVSTGLENSYYNGSKQTHLTTLDGGDAVQTFTTNPNTLRVNDSGRGSGEPILEVD